MFTLRPACGRDALLAQWPSNLYWLDKSTVVKAGASPPGLRLAPCLLRQVEDRIPVPARNSTEVFDICLSK